MKNRSILLTFSLLLILATASVSAIIFDDFEDGDYTNNPTWTVGEASVQSVIVKYGVYALSVNNVAHVEPSNCGGKSEYSMWIYPANVTGLAGVAGSFDLYSSGGSTLIATLAIVDSKFTYHNGSDYVQIGVATPVTANWYKFKIVYVDNNTKADYYVYAADGNTLLGSSLNVDMRDANIVSRINVHNNGTLYYDNFVCGLETYRSTDVNSWITTPTTVSGTYSVDFNVAVVDGNELAVSLYLSDSVEGWDFPVFTDYNIHDFDNNASFNCADHNFIDSTNCTYSWDSWKKLSETGDGTKYLDLNAYISNGVYDENIVSSLAFTFSNEPDYDVNFVYTVTGILDAENGTTTVSVDANSRTFGRHVSISSYQWDEIQH